MEQKDIPKEEGEGNWHQEQKQEGIPISSGLYQILDGEIYEAHISSLGKPISEYE